MARKPNDVELIITAKNESEKAFNSVADALKEIEAAAKKGGGLSTLFAGFEKRLETISAKQKQFNALLGDTKQVQKAINSAQKFTAVVQAQEAALVGAESKLAELESTYNDVEKAANAARTPSEKLTKSLTEQEAKQASLAQAMAETRVEIERTSKALTENQGKDERATAAIDKQRATVIAAGQSWRDITKSISEAQAQISSLVSRRDNLQQVLAGPSKKSSLETELATLKEFVKESQKLNRAQGVGDATKSLTNGAKVRISEIESLLKVERATQAELTNDLSKTNAAIRRQEQALSKLIEKAGTQRAVYQDLQKSLNTFEQSAKGEGTARQQKNIQSLNASLVKLQENYDVTANKVAATNAALTKSSGPDPRAVAQFDALKVKINGAKEAVQNERAELDKLTIELRDAGVATDTLAARQKELDAITTRLTADEARLKNEMKQLGDQAGRTRSNVSATSESFLKLGNDTRQSLGFLQRIRGELLSIAATYTGVYAIGGAIRSIYDASVQLNKAQARFNVAFGGDNKKTAEEIAFVRKEADRLGISFEVALNQYSKFFSGIPEGSVALENIRRIFTGFSTAARVGGLDAVELERVFGALTQIFSKQQVQLEELKGQLGDALPGAVKKTADALGLSPKSLFKQIADGNVKSEAAILLANELAKTYGTQLPQALKSPAAALAQFQNQLFDLRLELANSGFIDTLTEALRDLSKELKSSEFRQGAKDLATLLGEVIKVGVSLVKNLDKVKLVLEIVFGAKIIGIVNDFRLGIVGAGVALATFSKEAAIALPRVALLTGALGGFLTKLFSIPVLLAGAGGFGIGTWLYKEFGVVRKVAVQIIGFIDQTITNIQALANASTILFTKTGEERKAALIKLAKETEADLKRSAEVVKQTIADINSGADQDKPKIIDPEQVKKDVEAANKAIVDGLLSPEEIKKLQAEALSGTSDAAADKLEKLRTKVGDALADIDREIQEKSGNTLQERLDSIRGEYDKLLRDITKAGGSAQFPNAQSSINQVVAIKQVEETEKEINKLIQERRTLISNVNEQAELGAITVEEATKRINETNARLIPQMNEALATARQIAAQINSTPVTQSVDTQAQAVALEQQRAKKEQLLALEEQINRVMEIRRERIQTINALVETGTKSEADAKREIIDLNQVTTDQLAVIIDQATKMAVALGDPVMVQRLQQVQIELKGVQEKILDAAQLNQEFASGLTGALEAFASGTKSAGDAFRSFVSDFLIQIARAIAQALILKAITGSIGGGSGGIGSAIASAVNHTGGIVGNTARKRNVPVTAFAGAVRYHSGGIAGLKSNEVPSILEKGEEVITRNDPRHQMNRGGGSSGLQVKIVNAIDSASVLSEALNSTAGQKTLLNAIRANKSSVKSVLA